MPKKTYIVKKTTSRVTSGSENYVSGTKEDIARYCGFNGSSIKVILNRWNADLEDRYKCTYTRVCVELVDSVPDGVRVSEA
jgi:hypothetical protein